jgi:tetratricopeptide (TPR) repeat protein
VMSWIKGLFGGKSDMSQSLVKLTDREYEQLFQQVLQGVAANWDEQRLLKLLGDRCGDRQMVVWLRGYGDRLLSESANSDLAGLLVRLGEIGCGGLGVVAQGIGVEMGNISVEQVVSKVEPREVNEGQNSEAEMLYQKGLVELQVGKYQDALDYFDRGIALKLNNFDVWSNRGIALQNLNRFAEAIESNAMAISLSGSGKLLNKSPKFDVGQSKKNVNSFEIVNFNDAISRYDNLNSWTDIGTYLASLGSHEAAIISFERSIKLDPNDETTWILMGISLFHLGRHEDAIISLDRGAHINPNDENTWLFKGFALGHLARYEEEIVSYDRAISINSDNANAWYNKGSSLANLGRYEEAIISYDRAIKLDPNNTSFLSDRGAFLADLGRYEEALISFDHAISINLDIESPCYNNTTDKVEQRWSRKSKACGN